MAETDGGKEGKKIESMDFSEKDERSELVSGKARSHDPDFKGPIKDRSCTDIPCCLIFVLYLIGMLIVGIIAFKEGDLDRLIYPRDSKGNTCGKDFADKKYLYFFDITKCVKRTSLSDLTSPSCPTPQVCVEKCPDETALSATIDLDKAICMNNIKPKTRSEFNKLVEQNKCAKYYIASTPVLYRCLPTALGLENITDLNLKKDAVDDGTDALGALMNAKNVGMKIFEDLAMVWYWILGAFVLAMLLSLLWIIITRWIAWPMVWFSILASLILMMIGIYFCYDKYKELEDRGVDKSIEWKFTSNLDGFTDCKKFWLASGIILTIVLVILLLIILVLRKRINIAIALIKESSRAVGSMISTLFFPIIPWILQLIVFVWFVAVALFLVTNGTAKYHTIGVNGTDNSTECDPNTFNDSKLDCLLAGYETNKHLNRMAVYHFFGWLWLMNFVIALGECVLAGAFASWYFAFHKPDDVPALPVISALGRTLRYHVGSLAFGAAIIAIVQFIRAVLEYIDRKLKESNQDNGFVKFVMKCMKCCFWCLEKCLRFLNKNAYIGIAIYGKSFCRAAKDAFFLLLRNALRVAAINGVTAFLLFIGKLLVVGIIGVGSFFWFDKFVSDFDNIQLSYSVVPIVVCVIGAWVVAAIFFDVYDMAIDTIFFCFLEDSERNDGSAEKPYYMSDNLKDILGK